MGMAFGMSRMVLPEVLTHASPHMLQFGPFNSIQRRWRKPVNSAQTRLESRTIDMRLDKLMIRLKNLKRVIGLYQLIVQQRCGYASLQLLSRWRHEASINISVGAFLARYPHIFEVFRHPVRRNLCCRATERMIDILEEEKNVVKEYEEEAVGCLKKLLMMSSDGTLNVHALWLIRYELGLPDDFRNSVLPNYPNYFSLISPDTLKLVSRDDSLAKATIEEWRYSEYTEKWLRESETRYSFPISFPTGFKIEKGFREKLKNWQRLPYIKPYEKNDLVRIRNVQRFEKRAVGVLHEFLSLMVEKMIPLERLSHFRRDFCMEVNVRELILGHPGIFYISTKGSTQTVFLRDGYHKGCLVKSNPVYDIRRKILDLVMSKHVGVSEMQPLNLLSEIENEMEYPNQLEEEE